MSHRRPSVTLHTVVEGILDAMPARVFWKDRDLVYLGCNASFAVDAGFDSPEDVVGKDDFAMVWSDQAEPYRQDDREVMESGRAKLLIEEPQTTPDGRTITLLTSKVPLRDDDGEIVGILGTYMDITARKQMEEDLQREQSLRAEAVEEAHHLRGILPICALCKKVRDDQGYWKQVEKYVSEHSQATFSHAICPACSTTLYGHLEDDE